MINIYNSTYFNYRGQSSEEYNLKVITIDNSYTIQGVTKEITGETSANGKVISFSPSIKNMQTKELLLAYVDEYDIPMQLTTQKLIEINDWLLSTDTYEELIFDKHDTDGFVYYVQVLSMERWDNFNSEGYFKLTVSFLDDFVHTRTTKREFSNFSSTTATTFQIYNPSNVRIQNIYPSMIEIENLQGEEDVIITNKSTNQVMELHNLPTDCKIQLYCDLQICDINKSNFQWSYDNFNYNWLMLKNGINFIDIKGKCTVNFYISFPFII